MTPSPSAFLFAIILSCFCLLLLLPFSSSSTNVDDGWRKQPHQHQQHHHHQQQEQQQQLQQQQQEHEQGISSALDCFLCKKMVAFVDAQVDSNRTDAAFLKAMDAGCAILAKYTTYGKKCYAMAEQYKGLFVDIFAETISPDLVCRSLELCSVDKLEPHFVHLAMTGDPSQMSVTWLTYLPSQTSTVKWGTSATGPFPGEATGNATTYLESAGYNHKAVIQGLEPNTKYYYLCGDEQAGWSPVYSFQTPQDQPQAFRIAMYGDQGVHHSAVTQGRIIDLVTSKQVDWVYHVGDFSYADDYTEKLFNYVNDEWFASVEPITSAVPYMTCPGNHEYTCTQYFPEFECNSWATNFTVYNNRFRMPGDESGSNTNMFYSFDYSFVHFVSISTETDYPNAPFPPTFGDQLTWLRQDLEKANANRDQVPWIIVIGHRPIYSSTNGKSSQGVPLADSLILQQVFEDVFHENNVDMYFAGHTHSYERILPIYANKIVSTNYTSPNTTVYVVNGAGGCLEDFDFWIFEDAPAWSAHRFNTDQGYNILTVHNASTLEMQFFRSTDNQLEDSFVLTRDL